MPLKNRTSTVPIGRTLERIEAALVRAGATNIAKDYAGGALQAVRFSVIDATVQGPISIRLPADVDAVYQVLRKGVKRPRPGTLDRLRDQAARTAWRLIQDWVEVQLSLIEMHQAELLQVFLPYVWNGATTFYAQLKGSGFRMLPSHEED